MLRHTDQLLSALVSSRRCLRKPAVPQVFLRFLGFEEEESGFQILPWSDQVDFSHTTFLIQVKEPFLPLEATVLPLALQMTPELGSTSVSITSFGFRK